MTNNTGPSLAIAAISLGVLIAVILSPSTNKWTGLYILLPISIFCSAISAAWEWKLARSKNGSSKNERDVTVLPMAASLKWLVVIPSISLSLLLFVRILFEDHFSSDAAALDFGDKHGDPDNPNLSFRGGSSWGHWIQGFAATLCAYASTATKDNPKISLKLECASYLGTGYIVYNFIKRVIKTPDTFATSSFMNNGCEWAIGAWVGIACGMLLLVVAKQRKANQALKTDADDEDEDVERQEVPLDMTSGTSATRCCASLVMLLFRTIGALFCLSVVAASVLTGLTWNNCADGGTECGNYDAAGIPIGLTVGLAVIPLLVAACGLGWGKFR